MSWRSWLSRKPIQEAHPLVDAQSGTEGPPGDITPPTDEDIQWARQQTLEIIRRARELDVGVELEELSR